MRDGITLDALIEQLQQLRTTIGTGDAVVLIEDDDSGYEMELHTEGVFERPLEERERYGFREYANRRVILKCEGYNRERRKWLAQHLA